MEDGGERKETVREREGKREYSIQGIAHAQKNFPKITHWEKERGKLS